MELRSEFGRINDGRFLKVGINTLGEFDMLQNLKERLKWLQKESRMFTYIKYQSEK
jgi:hypothetical protein